MAKSAAGQMKSNRVSLAASAFGIAGLLPDVRQTGVRFSHLSISGHGRLVKALGF